MAAEFTVYLKKMRKEADDQEDIKRQLNELADDVRSIRNQLRFQISYRERIDRRLSEVAKDIDSEEKKLKKMITVLNDVCERYENTEQSLCRDFSRKEASIDKEMEEKQKEYDQTNILDILEGFFKWIGKGGVDGGFFIGTIADYLDKFYEYFFETLWGDEGKGAVGFAKWLDLADTSSDVWKSMYEMFEKAFEDNPGIDAFREKFGKWAGGVGLTGDALGFIGSLIDTLTVDGKTVDEMWNSFQEMGRDLLDTIGDGYELFFDPDKSGIYGKVGSTVILAQTAFSFIGESISSWQEYYADGEWDMGDTGALMIDSSISGLAALIEGVTFGLVSEDTTGISADDISNGIKDACDGWVDRVVDYFEDNPDYNKEYQEAGGFKKAVMMIGAMGRTLFG